MWYDSFKLFVKKLGKTYITEKILLKTEMNLDDVNGNNYREKKVEWLVYLKNEVFCTAFSYARYCKTIEEITGFPMKDCLSAPGLGWKNFNNMRDESDEANYTCNDKHLRDFVRRSIKEGRVCAFNQYKSKVPDDVL